MTDPSDEALLAAHLRGDPQAFGELVARHERRIYGLCLRILGNREDAEDATQEAFLAALRKASSFRRAAAFSTWLYRIAVNAATDQARRRGRSRLTALDPEDAGLAVAPGGELGEVVAAAVAVQTALARVPEGSSGWRGGSAGPVSGVVPRWSARARRPRKTRLFTVPTGTARIWAASA